jgi:amidohydrolase
VNFCDETPCAVCRVPKTVNDLPIFSNFYGICQRTMKSNQINMKKISLSLVCFFVSIFFIQGQNALTAQIDAKADAIEEQVIEWRRYFHENPELSNREFETGKKIAKYLKELGLEVKTDVAHTGVVGILKGGLPGPTVALRADIDGLPVAERTDVPFKSTVKTTFLGQEVGVMHACGHDTHIAMLMGAAKILTEMKADLKGTVKFVFQPAEEGAPQGEEGGAELMVKEGVMKDVDAVFGLHISAGIPVGELRFKSGSLLAAQDRFEIEVTGKQAHGSAPWAWVDPIVTSAQIIMGLQTIVSRQTELTKQAAVITVGKIEGGVRNNIIPESCKMIGTIRTLDTKMQDIIHEKIKKTAELIAESAGATAKVTIQRGYPVTYNNPELTKKMMPTVQRVAGIENVVMTRAVTGAEDFSFFAREVPGLFMFLGGRSNENDPRTVSSHHTPDFFIDEKGMKLGVRTLVNLTLDYFNN